MNEIRVMTIPELSQVSGMSQFSIRQLCKSGKLPYLDIGHKWLVRLTDFEKLFTTEEPPKERCEA